MNLSILADVGGTNTRVALADGAQLRAGSIRRFANDDHDGIGDVLRLYLTETGQTCTAACVAVAGPVSNGRGELTNRAWSIDHAGLTAATGAEHTAILNDLQAQGHALPQLDAAHLRPIRSGPAPSPQTGPQTGPHSARLVIGVGTGFNIAPVYCHGDTVLVPPSEAGHAILPVRTEEDLALSHFVAQEHGFPGVEDVLSGRGLERLYAFAAGSGGARLDARAVMAAVQAGDDPVAAHAARLFCALLGTVAGNLALIHLPFGGVYLIGGVSRALAPYLTGPEFENGFRDKGRFSEFMDQFAVHVVEDDYAALAGCAAHLAG